MPHCVVSRTARFDSNRHVLSRAEVCSVASCQYRAQIRVAISDNAGRLASDELKNWSSNAILNSETCGYSNDDNLTSETNSGNGRIGAHAYTYDKAGRIASLATSTGTTAYTYDGAGNRLTAGSASYTYDARNRMLTGPASTYVWKNRGSPVSQTVSGVTTTYTTDAAERITSTVKTGYTATNTYDVLDRVVSRTAGGVTTLPRYAGFDIEPTAILPSTSVGFVSQFARSVNGQLLAEKTNGVSAAVALDRHGDAVMWYPTTGVPISAYKVYDPFGAITKSSAGAQSALGFQGQFTDATTGDVNMGARWYNPSGGSFRGRDTMFGSLSSPSTLNRYSYVSNNPLNSFDPNGREEFSVDLSTLSGFFGGDALGGVTETLGAGISEPVIVSYETANPSAGVYNYVANVSDGSSTIATIAPTGVNVSQPTTTVSSGYLAYTPNDATAAAAIVLIESGTPAPAIGQAINDAYNAISAAPTQEAILAVAATNAAATAAAAAALMAQETAANAAAQAAAQAAIAPAPTPTPTPNGPSEAPGDPDLTPGTDVEVATPGDVLQVFSASPRPKVVNLLSGRGSSAPLVSFQGINETGVISCSAGASARIDLVYGQITADGYIHCEGYNPPQSGSVGSWSISVIIRQVTFAGNGATFELDKRTGKQNNIPLVTDCVAGCLGNYEVTVKWTYTAPFDFLATDFGCKASEGFVSCKKSYFVVNNQKSRNPNV